MIDLTTLKNSRITAEEIIEQIAGIHPDRFDYHTPKDINTIPKTRYIIQREVHWFERLRAAELIISQTIETLLQVIKSYQNEGDELSIFQQKKLEISIDDTFNNLKVATEERDRLLSEHPQIKGLSSEDLQNHVGTQAFAASLGRNLATYAIAARTGIPPETVATLLELPKNLQELVFKQCQDDFHSFEQLIPLTPKMLSE